MSPLTDLLRGYSAEVTSRDRRSIEDAASVMARDAEVFIASLPSDTAEEQILAAVRLMREGLHPVPHIVARNIPSLAAFDSLLARLTGEAGVDRVLVLAGDRAKPAGAFDASLQLIQTGLIQRYGIKQIGISAYPEGHPHISDAELQTARNAKLVAAAEAGLQVMLLTQFCFDPAPIVALARDLRRQGVTAPLRIGVAGPASRASLLKYAMLCGIGASMRALKERQSASRNLLAGETPEDLLTVVAEAQNANPALGMTGVHFFTFASLNATGKFVEQRRRAANRLRRDRNPRS